MACRVVVADDHQIFREALRLLLERHGKYEVVAEAESGAQLTAVVRQHAPDVVVMDYVMPGGDAAEAARQLRAHGFAGGLVVLSGYGDRVRVQEALRAGVDAYVLKVQAMAELETAVAAALRHEHYVSPQLAAAPVSGTLGVLTARELEVLQLIAEGHATKEIAFRLGLSAKTVETHRVNLMRKLAVNNVADLTRIAVREGLITL